MAARTGMKEGWNVDVGIEDGFTAEPEHKSVNMRQ